MESPKSESENGLTEEAPTAITTVSAANGFPSAGRFHDNRVRRYLNKFDARPHIHAQQFQRLDERPASRSPHVIGKAGRHFNEGDDSSLIVKEGSSHIRGLRSMEPQKSECLGIGRSH